MNIPLAHVQGGEVTGNIDEKVRHAITKLSDYHFVSSDNAKDRVIKLGEEPDSVFNTGCPSIDLAKHVKNNLKDDFDPIELYGGVGANRDVFNGDYLVVMQHPVTTEYKQARNHVNKTLAAIKDLNMPTYWFWPNVDAGSDGTSTGIRVFREVNDRVPIRFFKNMEPHHFLQLLIESRCLIGNSSVGIRECSYLGVPVVNIGTRQMRRQRGNNVIDVGYDSVEIKKAILSWLNTSPPEPSNVYGGGNAGKKIADILSHIELKYHKTITY